MNFNEWMLESEREAPTNKREAYHCLLDYILDVSERKDNDYSPQNINVCGRVGLVVRVCDKVMRLKSLIVDKREQRVNDESVEDTWFDLVNYGFIALLFANKWWNLEWGSKPVNE
ncbi:DUF1599 domain-containing protein [Patescibacteria group bacterium]|nr:DUF1599 domain-containing protein [Patescibacteria group bacterium]